MKKLLSLLAVLAIVISCCVMGVGTVLAAPDESSPDDFMVFDGVLEEYVGSGGDVIIPASLGVKEIAANAFENNNDITSLVIPEGVETVGYWSFRRCESLESITLPYSLTELAEHAFSSAPITEITIPGNVSVVGYGCFSGCTFLENITLSYGVEEIHVLAFQATAAKKIVFPETVELICGSAFANNWNGSVGKIEYYICNPDCEIGSFVEGSKKCHQRQWSGERTPWGCNKTNPTYKIYVVENSQVEKTLTAKLRTWMDNDPDHSASKDGLDIISKEASYFKELPENQEGYGTPKPNTTDKTPSQGEDPVDNPNKPSITDKENGQNGPQNGNQTVIEQGGDNTALIIVACVIGGVMLLAIIVVVILAATGVLFGKKKETPKSKDEIISEYLKEQQEKEAERERIRAELLAEMGKTEQSSEE